MIDPLAVVIAHLEQQTSLTDLVGGQIASRHRFALPQAAKSWQVYAGVGALTVRYAPGGQTHLAVSVQTARFEARCYGVSEDEAAAVWRSLIAVSRGTQRESVITSDGVGLLYWLVQDGSPDFGFDGDLKLPVVVQGLRGQVHENSLT
jgi:hypothetical protein